VDGKIYVIGGTDRDRVNVLSSVLVYDPTTDQWATATDMPTARANLTTVELDGELYAIGGAGSIIASTTDVLPTVEKYSPVTDTWEEDLPNILRSRAALSSSVVDGTIYVMGGEIVKSNDIVRSDLVEAYTPEQ